MTIRTITTMQIETSENIMIELLQVGQEYRIDSRIVAQNIGIDHHNLMQTLRTYQERLERFGQLLFQTEVGYRPQGGGNPILYVMLNRNQVSFAITLSRNTEQVVAWKFAIIDALDQLEKQVHGIQAKENRMPPARPQLQATMPLTQSEKVVKTIKLLNDRGNLTPTARDIARQMHKDANVVHPCLENLVQEGIVQSIQGRQTLKYVLVSSPDTTSS